MENLHRQRMVVKGRMMEVTMRNKVTMGTPVATEDETLLYACLCRTIRIRFSVDFSFCINI